MDIVRDIIERMRAQLGEAGATLPESAVREIEQQVRKDWGGDRVYIKGPGAVTREEMSVAIRGAWARGEPIVHIARRFGVTRQRVWQIVRAKM